MALSHDGKRRKKSYRRALMLGLLGIVLALLVLSYPIAFYIISPQSQPSLPINAGALSSRAHPQSASHTGFRPEDITTGMPSWMKDYLYWHATARAQMNQDHSTWKSYKFLMLQCLPGSRKCGGTADRLKPLPLMLWQAHQTQRLLLIKWGRPAELEEFLLPPQGGLDWKVPDWLYQIPEFKQGPRSTSVEELLDLTANPEFTMVKARVQTHDHGAVFYNSRTNVDEPTFEQVYHIVWRAMFTPAPPVAQLIERQLQESQLSPGRYVGIHIRALYAVSERDPAMVEHWTRNAIHCASQLQPGGPFYLSSDSSHAVSVGRDYGQELNKLVASRSSNAEPYHLDKAPRSAQASDFYDTFVDLYLLAMGGCVTYNMGGYGTWALLISPYANNDPNGACSMQHHNASGIHKCEWVDGRAFKVKPKYEERAKSLFLAPMS